MRIALVLGIVVLALFAVSAGASVLLFSDRLVPGKAQEAKAKELPDSDKEMSSQTRGNCNDRPLNPRTGSHAETEQVVQLLARLREQEAQQNKQQQKLAVQLSYLEMMQNDMRQEHEADERTHKEIRKELDAVTPLRAEVENKAKEAVDPGAVTTRRSTEAKKTP